MKILQEFSNSNPLKYKRKFLVLLLYSSIFMLYFFLIFEFQDQLSQSPLINITGGALSFIILIIGGILGFIYGIVSGNFGFMKFSFSLLPWGTTTLRIVSGLLACFILPILYISKARFKPHLSQNVTLFLKLLAIIFFPAVIFLIVYLLTK